MYSTFFLFLFMTITSTYSQESLENRIIITIDTNSALIKNKTVNTYLYSQLKEKYDTLIPIFDGLFITYNRRTDTVEERESLGYFIHSISQNSLKWGVIDSTGNVFVPLICDGVKAISEHKGIASIYVSSYSLNTGIPRYMYTGKYFYFNKLGRTEKKEKAFSVIIAFISDYHSEEFVTMYGPEQYLPQEVINSKGYFKESYPK